MIEIHLNIEINSLYSSGCLELITYTNWESTSLKSYLSVSSAKSTGITPGCSILTILSLPIHEYYFFLSMFYNFIKIPMFYKKCSILHIFYYPILRCLSFLVPP